MNLKSKRFFFLPTTNNKIGRKDQSVKETQKNILLKRKGYIFYIFWEKGLKISKDGVENLARLKMWKKRWYMMMMSIKNKNKKKKTVFYGVS